MPTASRGSCFSGTLSWTTGRGPASASPPTSITPTGRSSSPSTKCGTSWKRAPGAATGLIAPGSHERFVSQDNARYIFSHDGRPAMISAQDALTMILGRVPELGPVTLSIRRAGGHALAEKITAAAAVPPFDNSAMDGFAVIAADIASTPAILRIAGETAAGSGPGDQLSPGEARAVATGAPVPAGADTVVPVESTGEAGSGRVIINTPVSRGANIRRAGSDISIGSTVFDRGHLIRPFEQGILASLGIGHVTVRRRPSVCLLSTGDELAGPGTSLGPGKIRESNSHVIGALLGLEGCGVVYPGITPDDPAELALRIAAGLR